MGRNHIPLEIKQKRGTFEKNKSVENSMQPDKLLPNSEIKIPTFLNRYGKIFFQSMYQKLTQMGVLSNTDIEVLSACSLEWGKYIEAQYKIKKNGAVTVSTNKNGSTYEMVSPWLSIANNALKNFITLSSKLGLNPADRQKIASAPIEEKGVSLEDFLSNN
ncbi:phage terminase small subunit P27 family [Echinicola shivajiensis]|uniref:phage terminase small subunit P27 family n=1 Tax=Echinicola shivajiensis TaxID=1035916 RepID=UPI001BFCC16F|nr:phage terminase small subunit P27 family [Echinicola shivajiensis]